MVDLAIQMGLTPSEAVALPAAVDVVARQMGATRVAAIRELTANAPLRAYMASICRKVTSDAR